MRGAALVVPCLLMPSTAAAKSSTLSKREVIQILGKSKRTVEGYVKTGRLAAQYFTGPNGLQLSFRAEDVERLKRDIDTPVPRVVVVPEAEVPADKPSAALGPHIPDASRFQHFLAEVLRARTVDRLRPWLPLAEAAEYSGLPASYLLAQARAGTMRAVNVGSGTKEFWRFHRAGLAK